MIREKLSGAAGVCNFENIYVRKEDMDKIRPETLLLFQLNRGLVKRAQDRSKAEKRQRWAGRHRSFQRQPGPICVSFYRFLPAWQQGKAAALRP